MNETLEILRRHGLRPIKRLGQNFLLDRRYLNSMLAAAEVGPQDVVLEIGPGLGILTAALASRAFKVIAVELDRRLEGALQGAIGGFDNVRVVWGDVLGLNLTKLLDFAINEGRKCKAVANLPYYITSPVVIRLLTEGRAGGSGPVFERAVLMVQKEVAQRMVAGPGGKDYGAFSVIVQYYSEPEIMREVPKEAFFPRPKVDSSIVRLRVLKDAAVKVNSSELFFGIVRAAFSQRRKTLKNALRTLLEDLGIDEVRLQGAFAEAGIDPARRGETLGLCEFAALADGLMKFLDEEGGKPSSSR